MKAVKRNPLKRDQNSSSTALAPAARVRARTGTLAVSPPTTIELRGVPIHFPFRPYKCQEDYMGVVLDALLRSENALLESPTGTGKTLCLLCATLAWQRQQVRQLNSSTNVFKAAEPKATVGTKRRARAPTIIYASRTHSQLSQVVRELRNTRYRPKHAVLGSREQMCVNPKVKKATSTSSEINHDCSKRCKERKCGFKNKLEGFAPPEEPGSAGTQRVMDMEDLLEMGRNHRVCPFYFTRSQVEDAELVLVPYNYLFDKDSRSTTLADIPWDNSVVIFDEAHNLESFASESASFDLSSVDIAGCIGEINRAIQYMQTFGGEERIRKENVIKLKSIFMQLEEYILGLSEQSAYRGEFMMEVFQKGATISHANHELFINEVRKLTDVFMEVPGGSNSRGAPRLDHFVQCVKRVFGESSEARCLAKAQSYRVHITPKTKSRTNHDQFNQGRTISYWCFAPSEAMRELANLNVRSILVTSGTLSPLESYALELDLPFPNRLENPHIIPDDQIHVRVVGKGVSGKLLTSSYERRQDADYYSELGNTLVSLGKVIPGGMLVFFPSYGVMETCLEKWGGPANSRQSSRGKQNDFFAARRRKTKGKIRYSFPYTPTTFSTTREISNQWKRLLSTKAVVIEPKASVDLPDAIAEFHKYLGMEKSKGVALFGVCRGKISEGIDFADEMCRAVVITGLPFAPSFDPKVKMKREFLDQNRSSQNFKASTNAGFGVKSTMNCSLSGHEWYTQQAHRAVNQAIGRVIRNKNDYGAVLLLDSRFGLPANQQGLSKWLRPHVQPDQGVGKAIGGLVNFYRNAESKARQREKEAPPPESPNQVSMILKYEEEGKENKGSVVQEDEFTKVAIIQKGSGGRAFALNTPSEGNDGKGSPNRSYIAPDRIIARVDMKTQEGTKHASTVMAKTDLEPHAITVAKLGRQNTVDKLSNDQRTSNSLPSKLHSALQGAADSLSDSSEAVVRVHHAKLARKGRNHSSKSPSAAMRFFEHVQSRMSVQEQSTIKKAVVSMKQFSDQKHRKAFLRAAQDIITILLDYESFENQPRGEKPELLSTLFLLLPKYFLHDVQKVAVYKMADRSNFGKLLKSSLSPGDRMRYLSDISLLLWETWFQDADEPVPQLAFLKKLKKNMEPLFKEEKNSASKILRSLSTLVPFEYRHSTEALISEMTASQSISRMKTTDKNTSGEETLQVERFRTKPIQREGSSEIRSGNLGISIFPNEKQKQDVRNVQSEGTRNSDQIRKIANPYSRKSANDQQKRKSGSDLSSGTNRPTKVGRGLSLQSLCRGQNQDDMDTVKRVLHQSESDTYTGKSKAAIMSSVESNVPKNLSCQICDKADDYKVRWMHFIFRARICTNRSPLPTALPCRLRSHGLSGMLARMVEKVPNLPSLSNSNVKRILGIGGVQENT